MVLGALENVFRRALRRALRRRSDDVLPLVDGDPFHHRYRLFPGGRLEYQFAVGRGILYGTVDLTGRVTQLMPGGISNIELLDCAEVLAAIEEFGEQFS